MTETFIFIILLFSALCHAIWSALIKSSSNPLSLMGITSVLELVIFIPLTFTVPLPTLEIWYFLIATIVIHVFYNFFFENFISSGNISKYSIKQKILKKPKFVKEYNKFSSIVTSPIRKMGSASLDMAYVASGRFDGYFHNKINIWDIAAGVLIINEAGGKVNDINKFDINNIDIRASNNNIYNKMLENLKNF